MAARTRNNDHHQGVAGKDHYSGEPDHDFEHASPPMVYKSRHISIHSRVESLGEDFPERFSNLPLTYGNGRERSTFYLESGGYGRGGGGGGGDSEKDENEEHMDDLEDDDDDEYSRLSRPLSPGHASSRSSLEIPVWHETLFIGVVIMAQFMGLAGLGQSIAPMKFIAEDLGVTNPGEQAWFAAAFSLTVGTFILISGRMGDILGHKRIFTFGYFFLGSWSAFAGFSAYIGDQIFFDICRAFQGLGAALLAPNALALLGRAYPPGIKKNIVFSLFGAMAPWGFVVGAIFASMFAEVAWWPWAFWSYGLAAWLLSAFSIMIVPQKLAYDAQFAGKAQRPAWDLQGSFLGVLSLILINVALNNGPLFGWDTPHVYFILILGLCALGAFIWVEAKAVSPILPVKVMSSTVVYTMVLVGIGWGSFGIWIYYSFRFLEDIRGFSPLSVSAQYVPAMICGLLAAGATGFMLTHTPVAFTMFVSMAAFFIGELITATQPAKQTYWGQMFVAILIMPFGMDMSFPAATLILSNSMPPEHQGLAASLVNTMVNYSISIALGIAGTVEVANNRHGATPDDIFWGIRCAWWTGVALAGCGVVLGAAFFGRTLLREGWKIMDH
ncbi:hypothetical protein CBER1_03963 [Cercospora berteroae]|uniref:Major facilitator superfamily (MFS) profile domain-containing protein n=1 Tax=Cercospora berteroae TaxID=357750 RepID=A0A2S6CG39_9PEZI|nr:hypothetical protein CBER1_03963 [Cercospora berteroae]